MKLLKKDIVVYLSDGKELATPLTFFVLLIAFRKI